MKILDLGNLTTAEGFRIDGTAEEESGWAVSGAGDVNGDRLTDVIIFAGNPSPYNRTNAGISYVVYGKSGGYQLPVDLATLNTTSSFGICIFGAASGEGAYGSVSGAGDVNGDDLDDIIIGAPSASPNGRSKAGSSYVVYGQRGGYATSIDLSTFNTTTSLGFRIDGATNGDGAGWSISSGDINGDGLADVIIGAYYASPYGRSQAGSSYVVYGQRGGYATSIDLATFNTTTAFGFRIDGAAPNDESGDSVSSAGDVNGDGLTDVIIGAQEATPNGRLGAGSSYVVYGQRGGYTTSIDLATFNTTTALGFRIDGASTLEKSGWAVSGAGDVNGDGLADVIIGAPDALAQAGSSYVIYGKSGGYPVPIDLEKLTAAEGFRMDGPAIMANSGNALSNAGDVNGDGLADVIIGANQASPNGKSLAGSSYVIYGNKRGYSEIIDLATLYMTTGFHINGATNQDHSGSSVSYAGDVNGDGIADVIISAPYASPNERQFAGSSYVIYGSYIPCELRNNTLVIQYQSTTGFPAATLTTTNLYAIDHFYHSNDSQIQFTISNLVAGKFELISSEQTVTSFNQQQIKQGDVRFVQDGSPDLPAYEVSVANVKSTTTPQPAVVTFIAPPFVIGSIKSVFPTVDTTFQPIIINTTQIFKDSNYPLQFRASTAEGNPLPEWMQFSIADNTIVTFQNTAPIPYSSAGTTTILSLIATNSYNLSNHADFNITVHKQTNQKYITDIIVGSTVGGAVGLAALAGSAFGFWRYRKGRQFADERKNYPFANLLREKLQLSGIDDFQSNAGLAFVNAIEVLSNELQLQDIDVRNMYPNELDTLSVYVANAIKTSVHIPSSYFGMYKTINPEDIQNNAETIAKVTKALCQAPINEANYGTFINS